MSVIKCIRGKVETGKLSKEQAAEIEERVRRYEEKNRRGMNPEQAEEIAAKQALQAISADKSRKAKQTKIALNRQAELMANKTQYKGDGNRWLLSEMDMDPWGGNSRSAPVSNLQEIHQNRAFKMMNDLLSTYRPRIAGIRRPRAGMDDVVRELHGQNTGIETAKEMAEGFRAAAKYLWTEFNRYSGDAIKWKDDWAMPHIHDPVKVGSVTPDQWIDDIIPLLNRDKMLDFDTGQPLSDVELRTLLRDTYQTIRTHGMIDKTPGALGGRSVGNRRSDARMLQFKDGDAWIAYNQKFGVADPLNVMIGYVHSMSRDIGLMQKFGPNPKAMVRYFKDFIAIENAKKPVPKNWRGYISSEYQKTLGHTIDTTYGTLSGSNSIPVNSFGAGLLAGSRNLLSGALLQRAFLSALTDLNGQRIARRMVGLPETKVLGNLVLNLKGAMKEDQQLALHLGLGADSWTQTASGLARFVGDVTGPEWTRRVADTTMRATLLTPWTQGGKNVFGMDFYSFLHRQSANSFDKLPAELKSELSRFGIESNYWDVIRKAEPLVAHNGAKYVDPFKVMTDEKLGMEAATRLQNMELSLQRIAVIESSPRVRAAILGEGKPGTISGEALRSFGLFKNFPLTLMHMQLFNAVNSRVGGFNKAKMFTNVVIGSAIFGGLAFQAKEIQSGRDPMDMSDQRFWGNAFLQGGGLSLFGDFIFSDQNRFGKGFWASLAGPVVDFLDDVSKLTVGNVQELVKGKDTNFSQEAFRFAGKYMPGGKFWYWGLAFQRMVLDQLDMRLDPKAYQRLRQQEKKAMKERKQRYWWRPGKTEPDRAPDVGAAVGQ